MRNLFSCLSLLLLVVISCAQHKSQLTSELNFGFEQIENSFPKNWENFGSLEYTISLDSVNVKSGRYSALIEHPDDKEVDFKALAFTLPENYEGKKITLSGYIKTENVTDGYAGLWMRIDPDVAFDNMIGRGVTGTTDWTRCEVTLAMEPQKTKSVVIGGLLIGKGKMWLDDLSVTIDGKDITEAKSFFKELLPAEKDTEYEKGSNITFPSLDKKTIDNLDLLGKIWGFLKYHHPEVGKGNYNWDYELFRMLPDYLKAKNMKQRDQILLDWIGKYGEIPAIKTFEPTQENAVLQPDHRWMEKGNISQMLKAVLKNIYANRHQGNQFYIEFMPGVKNPAFKNENPYFDMPYPDAGFRLLSLYRYWNMIHYFYPNRHLMDKDWNEVLREYIPLFVTAKDELEYELVTLRIIGEISDTHANLWGGGDKIEELRGKFFAPFRVQFIENKLVITDHYNPELITEGEFSIGDIITHINGEKVDAIVDSLQKYYPASNEPTRLRDIAKDLLRSVNNTILINYLSSGKEKQAEQLLYKKDKLNIYNLYKVNEEEKCYKLLDGNIGYITLATIHAEDIPKIKREFSNTEGIIIDIRNYPSTFVPFVLGTYFISEDKPFVKFTVGNVDNPGEFTFTPALEIPKSKERYRGKLVVLVNSISQSQAEYTAMAFRAGDNTTIIGSTTAGADGNVSAIMLPGGIRTMISGIGVYYPDGTETQRVGIIPDIKIEPTIDGIRKGKDELLEKAIEVIKNNIH